VTTDGGNSTDTEISLVDLNTEETSLHNLGKDVTKIQILTINDSYVPSLRALSSNLKSLQVLKIPNCGISDIDGLAICKQLKEVYLPFNEITSMASLMFLTNLEIIDLESNFIDGISELDYLSCLSNVKLLNLSNNPVCDLEMYEEKIYGHLGSLTMLDDFSAGSEKGSRNVSPSRKKNKLKAQVLNLESDVIQVQELIIDSKPSKNSFFPPIEPKSMIRPGTAIGGRSTLRPSSARPQTAGTSKRPQSRGNQETTTASSFAQEGSYSDLTRGPVMAGSVSASLRRRKKDKEAKSNNEESLSPFEALQKRAEVESKTSNLSLNNSLVNSFSFSQNRPQTSAGTRVSPVKKVSSTNINQTAEDTAYINMESQISTVEDETDRLLLELQEWRLQHSKTLEGIKSRYPSKSPTHQRADSDVLESIDFDDVLTSPKKSENPTQSFSRSPKPPMTPESPGTVRSPYKSGPQKQSIPLRANHSINPQESAAKRISNPHGIQPQPPQLSRQRMRNFQRRQDILQASRNNGGVQVASVISSPSTSPQQLLK